jgi:low temperature requirement protein LtrA
MTTPSRGASALIVVSLAMVAGLAAWYGREVWADSGSFVVALFGVPLLCAAGALVVERAGRGRLVPAVVGVLAAGSLVWSLLTALGFGLLLVPSLLLVGATLVSWADRRHDPMAALPR